MKVIPGFSRYSISENGVIRSTFKKCGIMATKIVKGYYKCSLVDDMGVRRSINVHRMVAITYVPNPENKPVTNHLDGNKLNNHYSNLEWCTVKENSRHAADNGLYDIRYGSRNHTSKSVVNTKTGIVYETIKEAAKTIPMDRSDLAKMVKGCRKNNTNFIYA